MDLPTGVCSTPLRNTDEAQLQGQKAEKLTNNNKQKGNRVISPNFHVSAECRCAKSQKKTTSVYCK